MAMPVNLGRQLLDDATAPSRITLPATTSPLRATAAQLLALGNTPVKPTYTQDQLNSALGKWYDAPDFNNQLNSGDVRYLGLADTGGLNIPKGFFSDVSAYDTFANDKVGGLKQAVQGAWDTGLSTYRANRGPITNIGNANYRSDASWLENASPAGTATTLYRPQNYSNYMGYYQAGPALQALQKSVYDTYSKNVSPLFSAATRNQNLLNNYVRDVSQNNDMTRWSNFREF